MNCAIVQLLISGEVKLLRHPTQLTLSELFRSLADGRSFTSFESVPSQQQSDAAGFPFSCMNTVFSEGLPVGEVRRLTAGVSPESLTVQVGGEAMAGAEGGLERPLLHLQLGNYPTKARD